jgi:hypothetical protein
MIRAIVLVLLTTISATGQDSTLVREYCNKLGQLSETTDIDSLVSGIDEMTVKYFERNPITGDKQKVYAMWGFSVAIKCNFLISFSNVGQFGAGRA